MSSPPEYSPEPVPNFQHDADGGGGKIVTFYSYKGGVGRSMALANLAVIFAKERGKDVIVVDWDLEAPGLHRFFGIDNQKIDRGVVDYLYDYRELLIDSELKITKESLSIEPMLIQVRPQRESEGRKDKRKDEDLRYESGGRVRIFPAGNLSDHKAYAERVTSFDWNDFYKSWNGGQLIEHIRNQLKALSAIALIDSRTGVTDTSGICTMQLPDVVVLTFVFNEQNIDGVERIAMGLIEENPVFTDTGRRPELLLLPSRRDINQRAEVAAWEKIADEKLGKFVSGNPAALRFGSTMEYLIESAVPYVPFFNFGENIAAESDLGREIAQPLRRLSQAILPDEAMVGEYDGLAKFPIFPPTSAGVSDPSDSPNVPGSRPVFLNPKFVVATITAAVSAISAVAILATMLGLGIWPFSDDVSGGITSEELVVLDDGRFNINLEGQLTDLAPGEAYWTLIENDLGVFSGLSRLSIEPSGAWNQRIELGPEFCSSVVEILILESQILRTADSGPFPFLPSDAAVLDGTIFKISDCIPSKAVPK